VAYKCLENLYTPAEECYLFTIIIYAGSVKFTMEKQKFTTGNCETRLLPEVVFCANNFVSACWQIMPSFLKLRVTIIDQILEGRESWSLPSAGV
jgi:hypothetical protein